MVTIYRKAEAVLINDRFNWANPNVSRVPRPIALHGTSSLLIENIQRKGLHWVTPVLTQEDLAAFRAYLYNDTSRMGGSDHLDGKPDPISLTTHFETAAEHANRGPEVLERIRKACAILDEFNEKPVPPEVRSGLEKIELFYTRHKPFVLFVDSEAYPLDLEAIEKIIRLWHMPEADFRKLTGLLDCGLWIELKKLKEKDFSLEEAIQVKMRSAHRFGQYSFHHTNGMFIPKTAIKGFVEAPESSELTV